MLSAIKRRLHRAVQADTIAGASNALFGGLVDRFGGAFSSIEQDLERADMHVLYRTYISQLFMGVTVAVLSGVLFVLFLQLLLQLPLMLFMLLLFGVPLLFFLLVVSIMYFYPSWKAKRRAQDINRNLPFALNHMSAVAGSGVPPAAMFELLVNFDEYGEIAAESEKIVTRVKAFGEDITTAMRAVSAQTPSSELREVFYGIISTSETGGSLKSFLEERAERALFDYRIKREKEISRLTTFASFYTAILVAAPLFLVTILAILEIIGGNIAGFPIKATCGFIGALAGQCAIGIIDIGAFIVIPILNVLFLIAIEVFQPEI